MARAWRLQTFGSERLGDLFLEDASDGVHQLDVASGTKRAIAASQIEFREAIKDPDRVKDWFLEDLAERAQQKGCTPGKGQCIGYKIPCVFKESADMPDNMYVADLYELVSFMGDVHRQINDVPDGEKMRHKVQSNPEQS